MDDLSYGNQATFVIWFRVLANQEASNPDVDSSRDENGLTDVWMYVIE